MDRQKIVLSTALAFSIISGAVLNIRHANTIAQAQIPTNAYTTTCKMVRAIDGDTIVVETKQIVHIRLLDCYAPEIHSRDPIQKTKGIASLNNLLSIVKPGDDIIVSIPLTNNIGDSITLNRFLGHVWKKDEPVSINQKQVESGFATRLK